MKKIPTLFERDWNGDRSRVLDKVHPGCEWVLAGEGVSTRKMDGTSCLIRNGYLYKRREIKKGDLTTPSGFEQADFDEETGKIVGWVPVDSAPENKYHLEAFRGGMLDGTYELLGPKVQGNPEGLLKHTLVPHVDAELLPDAPRTFDGLRAWLAGKDMEGIVFRHPDGRMAKIKLRDFGLKRPRALS